MKLRDLRDIVHVTYDVTREQFPLLWPLAFTWEMIMLAVYRGLANPALWAIDCVWRRLGRGRVEWEHWSPRIGDQVSTCSGGVGTVVFVALWRDLVLTEHDPGSPLHRDSLRNCCSPIDPKSET